MDIWRKVDKYHIVCGNGYISKVMGRGVVFPYALYIWGGKAGSPQAVEIGMYSTVDEAKSAYSKYTSRSF